MSTRARTASPRGGEDADMDIDRTPSDDKPDAKVVIVTNLTRNVVESHLQSIFGFYGRIVKIDLPLFGKSGQNRGKAALEYAEPPSAHKAATHMDGGQLDGAVLKVELSTLPVRSRSPSRTRPPPRTTRGARPSARSLSRSRSRSRSLPPYRRYPARDSFRGRGGFGRRGGVRNIPLRTMYLDLNTLGAELVSWNGKHENHDIKPRKLYDRVSKQ
ncbi:RNA-binding protein with serine-rich domain 1 [Hypsizygus marmoreus]|uniref:RNA-binding protein with serine-rich domain 1 n=1 Tax=Hypsizygus marmoreus TaxID=39966 RepID=A0A369JLR0_HYPMA|nr:RNA-binding protein with serine-rich domain 1 [Hypsizygus marmoreus]